jgi:uncharacterized protein with von Willebrand factor type A (vWA) domain
VPDDGTTLAVGFVDALRRAGVDVPVGATVTYARALGEVGLELEPGVYWAGRATLVRRPEDHAAYDRAFNAYWRGNRASSDRPKVADIVLALDADDGVAGGSSEDAGPAGDVTVVRYSAVEVLRHKDLADCTTDELDEAHRLMADVRLAGALRRTRRLRATRHAGARGSQPDLRRTVRRALRTGGELARPLERAPGSRPRRVVLLVDVSGSMEPYARALLRFAHAAVVGRRSVEAFALGTRLTRLTRALSTHDPDEGLQRVMDAVLDWSGGTRLGDGLRRFNDDWGTRGMARGAVVVLLSDGWDRGDPAQLADEMRRLRRVAHRIVWVNPLKATPGYAPLARGMAAALPHVDEFVEGHSIAALQDLVRVIAS